jgi:hypothetical protein
MYSDIISSALERFHHYLERNLPFCRDHRAARVSAFWTEHFSDRRNFPKVPDFLTFRQADYLYGIGDTKHASIEQKQREFEDIRKSIGLFTPNEFVAHLREPYLGAPLVFKNGNHWQSGSFLLNAGTTWRVCELLKMYGPGVRSLHACEIGAGWGACAYQLHQAADIASYTIIDLPENLCLSSTYLSSVLPDRVVHFVDGEPGATQAPAGSSLLLAGPYDLILNTVSLQEMDRETVLEYLGWAARSLAPDGVLVSFNSHDKEGVRRPSEYLTPPLELVHMRPFRKVPAGFFNTIPYEMVLRRREGTEQNVANGVDALGELIQLGLDTELSHHTANLLAGQLDPEEQGFLELLRDFCYPGDEQRRRVFADELLGKHRNAVTTFLVANWQFAGGNFAGARANLEQSLALGLADFACIRAHVMLSLLDTSRPAGLEALAGGLFMEIQRVIENRDISSVQNHIARVLDCPVITPAVALGFMRKARNRLARLK